MITAYRNIIKYNDRLIDFFVLATISTHEIKSDHLCKMVALGNKITTINTVVVVSEVSSNWSDSNKMFDNASLHVVDKKYQLFPR